SCERCKTRKIKCGRQRPTCRRCATIDAACIYAGRRKPGFPAGQRQFLEDKIKILESEVRKLGGRARSSVEPPTLHPERQSGTLETTVSRNSIAPESLIATLEKTRRVVEEEPPADLVVSATSLFFRYIHPWLPFLDAQQVFSEMALLRTLPPFYYALFGASIAYSYDPRLDRKSSDSFWTYTKRRTFIDILEEPSLKSLEALTVLILDLAGMTNGPQVWGALSIAVKFSVQLKLVGNRVFRTSAEDRADKVLNSTEEMQRRRLFWAIYVLDSYITITTGHPSEMDAGNIQYFLPSRNETWRGSPAQGQPLITNPAYIFSYQLELMDISRIIHTIFLECPDLVAESGASHWAQKYISCSAELFAWFQNLSPLLALTRNEEERLSVGRIPPTLVMLHAYYHALVLHLHGLVAYLPDVITHGQLDEYILDSRQRCDHSLTLLSAMISKLDKKIYDQLGWPFTWAIWTACRYILVRNDTEGLRDMSSFYNLLDCLKTSSRFWQISGKYWSLLKQAAAQFEAGPLAAHENTSGGQSVLLAMMDLRIPTSDLEDQARPDPILYNTAITRRNDVDIGEMMSDLEGNAQIRMGSFGDPDGQYPFNMSSDLTSDYWYSSLLFSSSGYQQ
ncbi:fungal-specific transcription factor domain-containing protein, partial [Leptodontidium sp. 2 PMI_412]